MLDANDEALKLIDFADKVGVHPRTIQRYLKKGLLNSTYRDRRGRHMFALDKIAEFEVAHEGIHPPECGMTGPYRNDDMSDAAMEYRARVFAKKKGLEDRLKQNPDQDGTTGKERTIQNLRDMLGRNTNS